MGGCLQGAGAQPEFTGPPTASYGQVKKKTQASKQDEDKDAMLHDNQDVQPVSPSAMEQSSGIASEGIVKAIFDEQNLARTNPKAYAAKLEKYLSYFKGTTMHFPGNPVGLMTNEGPAAYREAIAFLNGQESISPLKWSAGLAKAANDHAKDIGSQGLTGHTGSDRSSMTDRKGRYGQWQFNCGENCSFGPNTPEEIICQLIVDDGVASRDHRKNIFSFVFGVTGIAVAPHETMNYCCVLDYAANYLDA